MTFITRVPTIEETRAICKVTVTVPGGIGNLLSSRSWSVFIPWQKRSNKVLNMSLYYHSLSCTAPRPHCKALLSEIEKLEKTNAKFPKKTKNKFGGKFSREISKNVSWLPDGDINNEIFHFDYLSVNWQTNKQKKVNFFLIKFLKKKLVCWFGWQVSRNFRKLFWCFAWCH